MISGANFTSSVTVRKLIAAVAALSFLSSGASASEWPAKAPPWNNDRVMAIQEYGGVRQAVDHVRLDYYGFMAFKITSPRGVTLFIDPWGDKPGQAEGVWWFGRRLPKVAVDIGLVTHDHLDHNAVDRLDATMVLNRMAGSFELGDVKIIGIAEKHVCETQGKYAYRSMIIDIMGEDPCPPNETPMWNNSMFIIETGGLRILHWGDNRQNPPESTWRKLGKIDVAILPIGDDGHILSPEWGDRVMARLNPKIVIPSHYYIKDLVIPNAGGLESADGWVKGHPHTLLDSATLMLTPGRIKNLQRHVMYFGEHVAFPLNEKFPLEPLKSLPPVPPAVNHWKRFKN